MLSVLLLPFSWLYGFGIILRNWCYDTGIFKAEKVSVPVISVGNITAGGTGKTPFVEFLVRYFLEQNKHVVVLSRGYKRTSTGTVIIENGNSHRGTVEQIGDEPFQIARKFLQASVIIESKRVHSAGIAVEQLNADVIILDDGFQHRSIARDLDIVILGRSTSVMSERLLPAGLKREPVFSLNRAHVLVGEEKDIERQLSNSRISLLNVLKIETKVVPVTFQQVYGFNKITCDEMKRKKAIVFSGIGHPERFRKTISDLGIEIAETIIFPDHHKFDDADVETIGRVFQKHRAEIIITTEKDSVRLLSMNAENLKDALYFLEIRIELKKGKEEFYKMLHTIVERKN